MATLSFFADDDGIQTLNGSGLGFYGSAFGNSVQVGSYQDTTFITNGAGSTEGPQVNNNKWTHPSSGSINGAASVGLDQITNKLATLNIRFTHTSAINTQNAKMYIYDRTDKNNPASGVTTKVAEIIHPDPVQNANGSGDTSWITPTGSSVTVDFVASPGMSGINPGLATADRHDWYASISASPDSIGSKTLYGLYFELEYL